FEVYQAQIHRLKLSGGQAVVVFDAALLIETGYHRKMDRVVLVYADQDQQLRRLRERDRFTEAEALARIRSQMPLADKRAHADYVIENTGDRGATERQARKVFEQLKREAGEAG
ncbi:MAG TPA: dephospho-CoA kinase, partial [Nitrospirota bacterium]|nr:dephospho-CoA kinase [Nitrospirota bacterium]